MDVAVVGSEGPYKGRSDDAMPRIEKKKKKKTVGLEGKTRPLHLHHTLFVNFFAVVA